MAGFRAPGRWWLELLHRVPEDLSVAVQSPAIASGASPAAGSTSPPPSATSASPAAGAANTRAAVSRISCRQHHLCVPGSRHHLRVACWGCHLSITIPWHHLSLPGSPLVSCTFVHTSY